MRPLETERRDVVRPVVPLLIALMCCMTGPVSADRDRLARNITDATGPLVLLGMAATYVQEPKSTRGALLKQYADAELTTALATELLKRTVRERRPNTPPGVDGARTSFPSGHASATFAFAAVASEHHPKQQWLWYSLAAAVAWSRVRVNAHRWRDVAAGAALGLYIGTHDAHHDGGILLWRRHW